MRLPPPKFTKGTYTMKSRLVRSAIAHASKAVWGTTPRRKPRLLAFLILTCAAAWLPHQAVRAQAPPIASVELTPGWVTFGQVVPRGLAPSSLNVGGLPTQTDVKTRWDDNSIRFAIVTVHADAAGTYGVVAADAAGASFVPQLPIASVNLTINGVIYTADLPAAESANRWLSGPLAYEGRSVVTPAASGTPHPFLRVIFDTRVYNDDAHTGRVDVTVENVLNKAGATMVPYDASIVVDGVERFSQAGVKHFYLTRWRKTFETIASFGSVKPDLAPFNIAGAVPPFLPLVDNHVDISTNGNFDLLGAGAVFSDMSAHGGRAELAPYPDWIGRYLAHRDPAQRAFVLTSGDLAGSWPVHVREPEDAAPALSGVGGGRFVSLNQRPNLWFDERAEEQFFDYVRGLPLPIREYSSLCTDPPDPSDPFCRPVPADQTRLVPDNAHQPSLAYVPYLLTGDRYYADEMVFWADYAMMRTYPGDGVRGADGILEYNEVRGFGWALRNLVDAAAYAPESSVRSYLQSKVAANLQWLDEYAAARIGAEHGNPLGILWTEMRSEIGYVSLWEQTYLAFAIDRANRQGFAGGLIHRDAIANLQLQLFTSPDYPPLSTNSCDPNFGPTCSWGAPYLIAAGIVGPDPDSWAGFTLFTTMAELSAATQSQDWLQRDYAGFYGPEARLNLMIGIDRGWAGAQGAYDYLFPFIGTDNAHCSTAYGGFDVADRPDLACRAGWALGFYPGAGAPPPPPPVNHAPVVAPIADQSGTVGDSVVLQVVATDEDAADSHTFSATNLPNGLVIDAGTGRISGTLTTAGDFSVIARASDGSLSGEASFSWHVAPAPPPPPVNHAPVVAPIADQSDTVGDSVVLQVVATDEDTADSHTFSATNLPNGLVIDAGTGRIFGTLTTAGDYAVTVRASDGSLSGETSFSWHVDPATPPPSPVTGIVNPGAQLNVEKDHIDLTMQLVLSAPGTKVMRRLGTFSAEHLPAGLRISARGRIHGEIARGAAAQSPYHVVVRFNDGSHEFTAAFDWVVSPRNKAPHVKSTNNQSAGAGSAIVPLAIGAEDEDGDALTFSARGLPPGLTISGAGVIAGTIAADAQGDYRVVITVSDGRLTDTQSFDWRIVPVKKKGK